MCSNHSSRWGSRTGPARPPVPSPICAGRRLTILDKKILPIRTKMDPGPKGRKGKGRAKTRARERARQGQRQGQGQGGPNKKKLPTAQSAKLGQGR